MIHIGADDRFRTTAACLLLTPYVEENVEYHRPHPLRAYTLKAIEPQRDHPCAKLFRDLVAAGWFGSHFYSLAAWLTPSSPFRWTAPFEEVSECSLSPEGRTLAKERGLEETYPAVLTSFLQAAGLPGFWQATREEWQTVCEQVRAALDRYHVEHWMESFWGPPPKPLLVVPNPTDPPTFGFAPSNRREAFCIIGPLAVPWSAPETLLAELFDYSRDESAADLGVHEFGHIWMAQARTQISELAEQTADVGQTLRLKDWFPRMYSQWPKQIEEMTIRAVQGAWRAEQISAKSADRFIQEETERFGISILPSIYRLIIEERQEGRRLGPEGCVRAARAAVERYRRSQLNRARESQ